jgi:hypothetical protein
VKAVWASVKGFRGEFRTALPLYRLAEELWREEGHGFPRVLALNRTGLGSSLYHSGHIGEMCRLVPEWRRDADERNDVYLRAVLRIQEATRYLAQHDPAAAQRCLEDARKIWARSSDDQVNIMLALTRKWIHLYTGELPTWEQERASWDEILSSFELTVPFYRCFPVAVRGSMCLAHAARMTSREDALRLASTCADEVERLAMPCALPHAPKIRAGVAYCRGDAEAAAELLRESISGYDGPEGNHVQAACCRRRLGRLLGGDDGAELIAEADATMAAEGIVNTERWTASHAPGFD